MTTSTRHLAVAVVTLGVLAAALGSASTAPTPTAVRASYADHLAQVDAALARADVSAAVRAWHDAWAEAVVVRDWRPAVATGDAAVRIGQASGARHGAAATAREAYLAAYRRAVRAGDADGVQRVAGAFARIGDETLARQCLAAAERLRPASEEHVAAVSIERF